MLRKAFENLIRHWVTTIPTILVLSLVLTMFHGLLIVHSKASETLRGVAQKFSITIYLKDGSDPFEMGNLITALEARSDVTTPVAYTSQEAASESLAKTFSLDPVLFKKYRFSLPASLTITPKNPADAPRIERFLDENYAHLLKDPVSTKEKQKSFTSQMLEFIEGVERTTLRVIIFFIILFTVGGALLIGSTIHLAITSRRLEMGIMKIVGASYQTITTPFVIEALFIAVLAFLLHLLFLFLFPIFHIPYSIFYRNVLLLEFAGISILSILVSYLTTKFHLRKKVI